MSKTALQKRIQLNLDTVLSQIAQAARDAGRELGEVQLVAVTKYAPWPAILALVDAGQVILGENRPQQLIQRAQQMKLERPEANVQWHLIGQLQRNKVRAVLPETAMIQSIDSQRLLERVNQIAAESNSHCRVLLEVNVAEEDSKSGFSVADFKTVSECLDEFPHVEVAGLMTLAPQTDDVAVIRRTFEGLRALRDQTATATRPLSQLSMGMSGDYQHAIAAGATIVRVGTALFTGMEELIAD